MSQFPDWLHWFVPYQNRVLRLPVAFDIIRKRFEQLAATGIAYGEPNSLVGYRYKIHFYERQLKVFGPYGNRRWTLFTQGTVQPGQDHDATILNLTSRLDPAIFMRVGLGIIIYAGLTAWVFRDIEDTTMTFLKAIAGASGVAYLVSLAAFRIELNRLVNLLTEKLMG